MPPPFTNLALCPHFDVYTVSRCQVLIFGDDSIRGIDQTSMGRGRSRLGTVCSYAKHLSLMVTSGDLHSDLAPTGKTFSARFNPDVSEVSEVRINLEVAHGH